MEQKVNVELWICKADMLVENRISDIPFQYSLMSAVQSCDQHKNVTIQKFPFSRQSTVDFWQARPPQWQPDHWHVAPSAALSVATLYLQNPGRPRSCWPYLSWRPCFFMNLMIRFAGLPQYRRL